MSPLLIAAVGVVLVAVVVAASAFVIVPPGHADVVERLGRYRRTAGPGLSILVPLLDRVRRRHTLADVDVPVPPVDALTQDGETVTVSGRVRLAVRDPHAATYHVADHQAAIIQVTQNVWRELVATLPLDDVRLSRGDLSRTATPTVHQAASTWGVDVRACEIVDITRSSATRAL